MVHEERPYDIIVFGATGYTGKYVVEELSRICAEHNLKFAIAGRSATKLKAALTEIQGYLDDNDLAGKVDTVVADVADQDSLNNMCAKTKLVLNCVGPYATYGEPVICTCIANGTHHVDISGESMYLEEAQAKYFKEAREKGIYLVQSCGYDSIPADFGTAILKRKFNGHLDSVKIFTKFVDGPEGTTLNIGTWLSAVHSIGKIFQLKKIRQDLKERVFTKQMPAHKRGLDLTMPLSYDDNQKKWCLMLPGPDAFAIERSQMFGFQFFDEIPVQNIKVYLTARSFFSLLAIFIATSFISGLALFSFGRYLLGKFPSFFSFGYFTKSGPTRKQVMGNAVIVTLRGTGNSEDEIESSTTDEEKIPLVISSEGKKTISLKITGPDAAYMLTSICMVHAGIVILEEADRMPLEGGVLTPGAAFSNTTLMNRLKERGIRFEWVE